MSTLKIACYWCKYKDSNRSQRSTTASFCRSREVVGRMYIVAKAGLEDLLGAHI